MYSAYLHTVTKFHLATIDLKTICKYPFFASHLDEIVEKSIFSIGGGSIFPQFIPFFDYWVQKLQQ